MPDIFNTSQNKNLTLTETPEDTPAVVPTSSFKKPTENIQTLKGYPPKSLGLLSYFKMHPLGVKFANQEDDETIVLFLRRHFFTNIPWILLTLFFLLVPIIVVALFQITNFALFTVPPRMLAAFILFYYLVIFGYALMQFVIWFYHVGI